MADHQKIHPVVQDPVPQQPLPKPTAPLISRGSSRSENGDPERQYPVPHRGTLPYTPPKPRRKRSCCKTCCCWTTCLILIIIILLGILAAIIYFGFQPRIPDYSVDSMRITQFQLGDDNSLSATFNVNITARNPNQRIGIYYERGSDLSVSYMGTRLCEGSLPVFYQGHRNTTNLSLELVGQHRDAAGLLQSLQVRQQETGRIPLNLRASVPVRIRLGRLRLTRWRFLVRCTLMADSLAEDNVIRVRDSSCRFRFRL